jgi:hypothetical protein
MRDLADWTAHPWPQLHDVTTAEQFTYALHTFDTARFAADREPHVVPFMDELRRRGAVTFDAQQTKSWFSGELRLGPDLADLWPLPGGVILGLDSTPPFGGPDSEPEDNCTEEELDRMVSVLGPLSIDVSWDCAWRGSERGQGLRRVALPERRLGAAARRAVSRRVRRLDLSRPPRRLDAGGPELGS